MKTWLKGGLIGIGMVVILIILLFLFAGFIKGYLGGIFIVLGVPWSIILGYIFVAQGGSGGYGSFIFYFEVGGFIGLILNGFIVGIIIGKIKSLHRNNNQKRKK